jgi:hypothetical protein
MKFGRLTDAASWQVEHGIPEFLKAKPEPRTTE